MLSKLQEYLINGTEWNEVTYSWDLTGTTYIKKDSDGYVGLSPDRLEVGNEIVITSTGYKDLTLKVTGTGKHWNVEKVTSQSEPETDQRCANICGRSSGNFRYRLQDH